MKYIKAGDSVNVMLTESEAGSSWVLLDKMLVDLGLRKPRQGEYAPEFVQDLTADPRAVGICKAVRSKSVHRLVEIQPDLEPQSMLRTPGVCANSRRDAAKFFAFYQASALLKKYPFEKKKGIDTQAVALKKFSEDEYSCYLYNRENYKALVRLNECHPDFLGVIAEMRADIARVLGELPDLERISHFARHGPGASYLPLYADGCTTSYYKWSSLPYSVTERALPMAKATIDSDPRWTGALHDRFRCEFEIPMWAPISLAKYYAWLFKVVDRSRITTVPKSVITDRTIAIEPLLNVYLQLGVDQVIRRRLKACWGYDLNDQEPNQKMAAKASITNDLVTVDLSSASDLISLKICELLLPSSWYDLLCDLRCPRGAVKGHVVTFEKISSMGNGFTFALESLIFGAMVRCAIKRTGSTGESAVYGDDLIAPRTAYPYLRELLRLGGFKINEKKTFIDGPFRESCGVDTFLGHDVRPFFLKRPLDNIPALFYAYNRVIRLKDTLFWAWGFEFKNTIEYLYNRIPLHIKGQFYGPPGDSFDTHEFTDSPVEQVASDKVYWCITPKAVRYNRNTEFFFRKLMALLPVTPARAWNPKDRLSTGNAFDVTRRDHVRYICTKVRRPL